MGRIRGVLFDKDGTIVDFTETWAAIARKMALEAAGGDVTEAEALLSRAGFDPTSGLFAPDSVFAAGTNAEVVALWHPDADRDALARLIAFYDDFTAREGAASAVPLPGIADALAGLHHDGYRLGLATNDSTKGAEATLASLGFARYFDAVYGYDAVARPKPAPDVVLAFADGIGVLPEEVAMVGDNRHDLEAARAAGAGLAVAVLSGTGTRETLARHADAVLGSAAELPGFMASRRE